MSLLDKADPEKMGKAIQAMAEGMAKLGVRSDMLSQAVSPIYKSISEHPGFTAQGAYDAFVKQYTQNQLDAAIAAERYRCVKLCEETAADLRALAKHEEDVGHYEAANYLLCQAYGHEDAADAIRNQEKN